MPETFTFTKPRFLLCEGVDDKYFFEALIAEHNLPDFQVRHAAECNEQNVGGRSGFRCSLDSGIQAVKGFDQLKAILVASDNDKPTSFAEVQFELTEGGNTPPATPDGVGSVSGKPTAVLLVPTTEHGDLEKLCLPELSRIWPKSPTCVTEFLKCTGADKWKKTASINKATARSAIVGFHEDDPYNGLGILFQRRVLKTANACFAPLVDFFRRFDAMVGI